MKALAILLTALAATGLAGCGEEPSVKDPRVGRVTLTESNCVTGSCIYDWEICIGPDLHMHVGGKDYLVSASPECRADS